LLIAVKLVISSLAILAFAWPLDGDKLDKDGILRKKDGKVRYLERYRAVDACPDGFRIPTAREFAEFSNSQKAKGILNSDDEDREKKNGQINKIKILNPNGKSEIFLFSHQGYKRPSGDLGKLTFFSSSIVPEGHFPVVIFRGSSGQLDLDAAGNHFAVRCIPEN
jgi:uncharacterized protein (TIGR02145 family)